MKIAKLPTFLFLLAGLCLVDSAIAYCQAVSVVLPPRWFQINIPEVDEIANTAVDRLSAGMSDVILALDGGRKQQVVVDPKLTDQAMSEFKSAREGLTSAGQKIPLRKINMEIIKASPYAKAYEHLVELLKQSSFQEPVDSKTYFILLTTIIDRSIMDLQTLASNPKAPAAQPRMVQAFLDLITGKMLLEQIGATSGIITIAMQ